jgi:hypothetical protein
MKKIIYSIGFALAVAVHANAQTYIIEPDNYTDGTVLNHIIVPVSLTTAGADNLPIPPVSFDVTASYDGFGYTSTGTNVFGHAGVPFWNTNRRLRMDFNTAASFIGTLLASYVSNPRAPGSVETMFVSRPAGDIAWAVAYSGPGNGDFIRLDHLQLTVVPEPSVVAMVLLGAICVGNRLRNFRSSRREEAPFRAFS